MTVQIIQSDDSYKIDISNPDHKINVAPSNYKIGVGSISGYGPKGDKGDPGIDGIDGTIITGISDVPGLQTALDGKAALIHTHIINDITDFDGTVLAGGTF